MTNIDFSINVESSLDMSEEFDVIRYDTKKSIIDEDWCISDCNFNISCDDHAIIIRVALKKEEILCIYFKLNKKLVKSLKAMIMVIDAIGDECWEDSQ